MLNREGWLALEFGDKEWFEKIGEHYEFPVVMAFFVSNKSNSILNTVIDTKAYDVGNIKYSKVAPNAILDNDEKIALVSVKRIHSANQYYEWTKKLKEEWN